MYIPKWFDVRELVPEETYLARGEDGCWILFDERLLITADALRDEFGPMYVNNWHNGGSTHYRGFRPLDCAVGATYSQHRFGRALDCMFRDAAVNDVREFILEDPEKFPHITALEMNVTWLHFDLRNTKRIQKFYP